MADTFSNESGPDFVTKLNAAITELNAKADDNDVVWSVRKAAAVDFLKGHLQLEDSGDIVITQDAVTKVITFTVPQTHPTIQRYPATGYLANTANDGEVEIDLGVAVAAAEVLWEEIPLVGTRDGDYGEYGEFGAYGYGTDLDGNSNQPALRQPTIDGTVVTVRYENWPVADSTPTRPGVCFRLMYWPA